MPEGAVLLLRLRLSDGLGSALVAHNGKLKMMVLSEFVLTHTKGRNALDWVYFADVTVTTTTGVLWWKKKQVQRRKISRNYVGAWFFLDDGTSTPGMQAEELERSYRAREVLGAA